MSVAPANASFASAGIGWLTTKFENAITMSFLLEVGGADSDYLPTTQTPVGPEAATPGLPSGRFCLQLL
jgi:hypothetical protein